MSKFYELYSAVNDIQYQLECAEQKRNAFLSPVLEALGINMRRCSISGIYFIEPDVEIEYCWSSRGYSDRDFIKLPRAILEAEDPVEAAKVYAKEQEEAQRLKDREAKEAQLRALQKELGQ